jgi:hypothetical protein
MVFLYTLKRISKNEKNKKINKEKIKVEETKNIIKLKPKKS